MKILTVGDLHIKSDNVEEIGILLLEIINYTLNNKVDCICLLGDILHTHEKILTPCLNRAIGFIKKCSDMVPTYVIVGNHDYTSQNLFMGESHWMNVLKEYKNVKIVDKVMPLLNENILMIPYVPPGRFVEALDTYKPGWKTKKFIFAHQEFIGCQMGAIKSETGDKWDVSWPQIISGHIHDTQTLSNIYYPGAPLQHSYGDHKKRIMCLIDSCSDGQDWLCEIELNIPKKHLITCSMKEYNHDKIMSLNGQVKIKLEATIDEFKQFKLTKEYGECIKKNIKFQMINTVSSDIIETEPIKQLDFFSVLHETLKKENDESLMKIYSELSV